MKCREGCDNERSSLQVVCSACWLRLPRELKEAVSRAWVVRGGIKAAADIMDWLAADDNRSKQ